MQQDEENLTREQIARLWCSVERSVQAFVFASVNPFQDAEDVVQEVAMTVSRHFDEYDPQRPFVGWALWLAKSRVIDHYRKQGRQKVVFSDQLLDRLAEVMGRRQPERPERQAALETCVEKLPAKSRRLLDLRYVQEDSIESIAGTIDSTAGSVRVMLFRIRDVLARCIQEQLATAEGR